MRLIGFISRWAEFKLIRFEWFQIKNFSKYSLYNQEKIPGIKKSESRKQTNQTINNLGTISRELGFELADGQKPNDYEKITTQQKVRKLQNLSFIPGIEDLLLLAEDDIEEALRVLEENRLTQNTSLNENMIQSSQAIVALF